MSKFEIEKHTTVEYIVVEVEDKVRECVCKCNNEETARKLSEFLNKAVVG